VRSRRGPLSLVHQLRLRGRRCRIRPEADRARLKRIIRLVDRCFPSGGNCYRRVLIEIAMDAGAAVEPFHLGLRAHGGTGSGHAWLGQSDAPTVPYEVQLDI
jgi:hypothetical protein